ncbi:hypothetical protein D0Y65_003342 [Glycine soja]|uniref:Uncharacterized protein n=1 Tax=Glycine soja TaxID=3848 RepID=A0A445LLJ8_GLYSO|nr:hypothetical protein D0Y65_003342 [Glycine soja]
MGFKSLFKKRKKLPNFKGFQAMMIRKTARESGWCSRRTWVVRLDGSGLRRLTCSAYENGDLAAEDWDKLKAIAFCRVGGSISKFIKREYNDFCPWRMKGF